MGKIQADIVVFLHTRNRPDFLMRALSNFREISTAPIIILDASDSPFFEEVFRQVEDVKDQIGSLYLLHHDQEASISDAENNFMPLGFTKKGIHFFLKDFSLDK